MYGVSLCCVLALLAQPAAGQFDQLLSGLNGRGKSKGGKPGKMDESTANKPSDGPICPEGQYAAPKLHSRLARGALVANGCGPQGMQVEEDFGLWRCCNRHDVCFSACDVKFSFCETMYKECMDKRCNSKINAGRTAKCKEQAQSFAGMTGMFGGGTFASSMKGVCDCVSSKSKQNKAMRAYATDIMNRFGSSDEKDNATHINDLVSKYEGERHGHLYFDLMMQYGHNEGYVPFDNVPGSFDPDGPSDAKRKAKMHNLEF